MFTSSRQNTRWTVVNWIHKWGGDFTGCIHDFSFVSFLTFPCFFLLRCRIPWFHYPIVYDIRSKPRKIISPTGSKGTRLCVLMQLLHVHTFNMNTVHNLDIHVYGRLLGNSDLSIPIVYRSSDGKHWPSSSCPSTGNNASWYVQKVRIGLWWESSALHYEWGMYRLCMHNAQEEFFFFFRDHKYNF